MKATIFCLSALLASSAVFNVCSNGPKASAIRPAAREDKPTITLTDADWRPPETIVFRAELTESKECREIKGGYACGMVPNLEVNEEIEGRLKLKRLIGVSRIGRLKKGRAYDFKWKPTPAAREDVAKAVKGGYSALWVSSDETFEALPGDPAWTPTDDAVFEASFRTSSLYWSSNPKNYAHTDYCVFDVSRVIEGRVGVKRLYCFSPPSNLVAFKEYRFRWKPSAWAKADLRSARVKGDNFVWLMFWESLEMIAPIEAKAE